MSMAAERTAVGPSQSSPRAAPATLSSLQVSVCRVGGRIGELSEILYKGRVAGETGGAPLRFSQVPPELRSLVKGLVLDKAPCTPLRISGIQVGGYADLQRMLGTAGFPALLGSRGQSWSMCKTLWQRTEKIIRGRGWEGLQAGLSGRIPGADCCLFLRVF